MGLSTHVLDTTAGTPAAGVRIELWHDDERLRDVTTNADGRTDGPLLGDDELSTGTYQLVFHLGDYYRAQGHADAGRFLDEVPIRFRIDDADGHWHVPLLATPWSYATYRGS